MKLTSYWMDTAPRLSGTKAALQDQYDVVVIGGGFVGLSAARLLAKAGKKVAVLEAGQIGDGASGRNGGHLNNGVAQNFSALANQIGLKQARDLYHAYDAAIDLVEATIAEERIDCDFRRSGKLKVAVKPSHVAPLKDAFEALKDGVDPDTAFLARDEVASEIRTSCAYGGLLFRKSASMHMGRYLIGLAQAAIRHGADLLEHCRATEFSRKASGQWLVRTEKGDVHAQEIILACGAQSGQCLPYFAKRIIPLGSFIIATRPLTEAEVTATLPGDRTYVTTMNVGHYFRLTADRRLIFGGRARFSARSDAASDTASGRILKKSLARMFPELAEVQIDHCFGGLVDLTRDRLPRAGRLPDGAYFAAGLSGHGAQMSAYLGAVLADEILGTRHARLGNPLAGLHWPAVPGYKGKAWFLPLAGLYYRGKDIVA
jgi:glycine/D-amino acid oxidase-like deaminating enzyme